jgi:hypothetical protein
MNETPKGKAKRVPLKVQVVFLRTALNDLMEAVREVGGYNNGCGCCSDETVWTNHDIREVVQRVEKLLEH